MPTPKFIVSSRATKGGPTQQVTIPAAIARKLPQGASIRWECSVVKGGLFFKYLGPNADKEPDAPEVTLDFVPAEDLKATIPVIPRKKAEPKPEPVAELVEEPVAVIDTTPIDDPEVDTDDALLEVEVEEEDLEEAPF